MQRHYADRVHHLMRRDGRRCWDLTELAAALGPRGPSADTLARDLDADPRFRLVEPSSVVPYAARWSAAQRATYGPALRRAGLAGARVVVLVGDVDSDTATPARLLDRTVERLAAADPTAVDPPPDLSDAGRARRLLDRV